MRVELTSPTGDAFSDFQDAFLHKSKKIEKIRIANPFPNARTPVDISSIGLLSYSEEIDDELRQFVGVFLESSLIF